MVVPAVVALKPLPLRSCQIPFEGGYSAEYRENKPSGSAAEAANNNTRMRGTTNILPKFQR
jgi:hypothetical protein